MFSQGKDSTPGAVEEKPRVAFLGDCALPVERREGLGEEKVFFKGLFYFSFSSSDSVGNKFTLQL